MTRLCGALLLLLPAAAMAQPAEPRPSDELAPLDDDAKPDDARAPDEFVPGAHWINEPTYEVKAQQYRTTTTESRDGLFADFGMAVSAGGGVSGFTDNTARNAAEDGGGWDIRATIGTRSPLAAEVSYLGSMQQIDALGLDNSALLVGNGVQANVRLNLTTTARLQPFVFAGAAWRHYSLANVDTNTSDVNDSDDVLEVPVGAGLAYRYRGFVLDARGEYRPATDNDLMPSATQEPFSTDNRADLHRWGVNANIGYEF